MGRKKRELTSPVGMKVLFWLYVLLLVFFVVVKFNGSLESLRDRIEATRYIRQMEPGYNLNLVPLHTIKSQMEHIHSGWAVRNLVANGMAFVPFGYLLPGAYRRLRKWWMVLGIGLLTICVVEVTQYVTYLGACDVDDLLLNMAGCIVGWFGYLLSKRNE